MIGLRKRNGFAILVLNVFLGWTGIGWVIAFVWAATRDPQQPVVQHTTTHHYTVHHASGDVEEAEISVPPGRSESSEAGERPGAPAREPDALEDRRRRQLPPRE